MPFNPNRINIHELTIEEPDKPSELAFDPERDITEEDWRGINGLIMENRKLERWRDFSYQARDVKIISNKFNLDDEVWQSINDKLEKDRPTERDDEEWWTFSQRASILKILAPERVSRLNLDETAWQGMKFNLDKYRNRNWEGFSTLATYIKILFPARAQELGLDEEAYYGIKDWLEENRRNGHWQIFSLRAMELRILFPVRAQELGLDEEAWQEMDSELKNKRAGRDWLEFSEQAAAMKIIAAKKVEINDNGLEITMPKSKKILDLGVPPLPETKKF